MVVLECDCEREVTMPSDASSGEPAPITPEQMRETRRLLGWSRDRLAMQSETIVGFVANFEDSGRVAKMLWHPEKFDALNAIRTVLEAAGVEFTNEASPGVRLTKAING